MLVLWVVIDLPGPHTATMAREKATTFVTGADGFFGTELLKVLVADGHRVFGLAPSLEAAQRVRRVGAQAVIGDLLEPGPWQDQAAAEWVFHLPPHTLTGGLVARRSAASIAHARMVMDRNLLDAAASAETRRVVYVADASYYGGTGPRPITEDEPLRPSVWGRSFAPALDRLDGYIVAGLPVITAFPGWIYGNGAWFRQRVIEPVMAGRRVLQFGTTSPWVSPIHVHDCARALVHLAERGHAGGRYFLVNSEPVRMHEFAVTFARLAKRPLRVCRVPAAAIRLATRPVLADDVRADAVFSNIRLRGIGFCHRYQTLEQGLQQVLEAIEE